MCQPGSATKNTWLQSNAINPCMLCVIISMWRLSSALRSCDTSWGRITGASDTCATHTRRCAIFNFYSNLYFSLWSSNYSAHCIKLQVMRERAVTLMLWWPWLWLLLLQRLPPQLLSSQLWRLRTMHTRKYGRDIESTRIVSLHRLVFAIIPSRLAIRSSSSHVHQAATRKRANRRVKSENAKDKGKANTITFMNNSYGEKKNQ